MSYTALYRKFRPGEFEDVKGQDHISTTLQNQIRACIDAGTQCDYFLYPGGQHNMYGTDAVHLHERITRYFEDFLK